MRILIISGVIIVTNFFLISCLKSQVNVEAMRGMTTNSGLKGEFDFNLRLIAGNVEIFDLGSGIRLEYQKGSNLGFIVSNVQYATKKSEQFINRGFTHIRYNYSARRNAVWELYSQYEFNEFIKLFSRILIGTGGRFTLREFERSTVILGTSYMLERENLDIKPGNDDKPLMWAHRWSNYVVVKFVSENRFSFLNTIYLQPKIDKFDDIRILNDMTIESDLTGRLKLTVSLHFRYDSFPPSGVKKTDFELRNGFKVLF
ncbi:DUF481 domain-containing protein [candidate division KSB1 bacterium]|nr:DUF481 domain-containing protein [candidate division KSB1 bacterium]